MTSTRFAALRACDFRHCARISGKLCKGKNDAESWQTALPRRTAELVSAFPRWADCKSEDKAMHNFSRGIWTCATLYVAIGLIGIFFLATQPSIATSSDGYGIAAIAAQPTLR
jgi:hypothetical protein